MEIEDFKLKYNWVLWFHKVNDNNWTLDNYSKIYELKTYKDVLFIVKEIENITSGMFFLMKEGTLGLLDSFVSSFFSY